MRISGGAARGIRLKVPPGARPATEQVRRAIFSSLGPRVDEARVLDLYCGAGSYGLEALSRGASAAVFVDRDQAAAAAVRQNASAAGLAEQVTVRRMDVSSYLRRRAAADGPFDLVFADPPYGARPPAAFRELVKALATDGRVLVEGRWGDEGAEPGAPWVLEDSRRYGDTRILVLSYPENS